MMLFNFIETFKFNDNDPKEDEIICAQMFQKWIKLFMRILKQVHHRLNKLNKRLIAR